MLDQLRSEIESRIQSNHPTVIIAALDRLLDEIEVDECSYYFFFKSYERLRSRITYFTRMYMDCADDGSALGEIGKRLSNVLRKIEDIRDKRYERVCDECPACRTRRKPWPETAQFITPSSALAVLESTIHGDQRIVTVS